MGKSVGIQELRKAIPSHCFRPSNPRSMGFVLFDLIVATCLTLTAVTFIRAIPDPILRLLIWMLYGYIQGLVFTGIWILAHECGHEALFSSKKANHVIEFILHSALLVPYFSWRYTHARHHRHTNYMEKNTAFVPRREAAVPIWMRLLNRLVMNIEDTPVYAICTLVLPQILGWPAYLLFYASGGPHRNKKGIRSIIPRSHLDPLSDLFMTSEQPFVLLSAIGVCAAASCSFCLPNRSAVRMCSYYTACPTYGSTTGS